MVELRLGEELFRGSKPVCRRLDVVNPSGVTSDESRVNNFRVRVES